MLQFPKQVYLASKSPRRRKLLKQIGLKFKSFSVDLDERFFENESPTKTVKRLADEKLKAATELKEEGIFITADTIVVVENKIIGKPKNKKDAVRLLKMLSGKKHTVYTGIAVAEKPGTLKIVDCVKTDVYFRDLNEKEIKDYVNGGSPMDKAGAYGIQDDFGAVFIKKINGCYYNVVGLPLEKLYSILQEFSRC
ncbi:MAG: septum formation inhibitor Maf [Chlorobi bacterium]|nr:septum formation inhibitor Maf [Chlorobiota bacterium]